MARTKAAADTWRVYQTLFSDHLESANAAPLTIRTYLLAVRQLGEFLRSEGLSPDPAALGRETMVAWMRYLQRSADEGGQGLSAQSALQRYRSISRYFEFLVDAGDIAESPLAKVKPPRVPEKLVPVIGEGDLKKLLKAVAGADFESRRDRAIIGLFIDTGLRIAEMAGIRLDDLDLEEREVEVLGKGRRSRLIRFVKETRSDLQRYLLVRARHPHAESEWLWLGKRGQLTANGVYQMIQRRCEDAKIAPIHPHMFRHTFAHLYLKGGGSEGDLMKVTGWKSRQMVDRYGASAAAARAADAHDQFSPRRKISS